MNTRLEDTHTMTQEEIISEIDEIITGIEQGELEHVQDSFHCGTAHCIAGWKVVRDFENAHKGQDISPCEDIYLAWVRDMLLSEVYYPDSGVYAQLMWRLNANESNLLFGHYWSIEEIRDNWENIKHDWRTQTQ